jgi:hypothetical protein
MSLPSGPVADRSQSLAAPVARSVAEDLESIFPEPPAAPPAAGRLRLRLGRKPGGSAGRGSRRAASLGGLAAAALVGVSAGALIGRGAQPARHVARPPSAAPTLQIALAAAPSPGPLLPPAAVATPAVASAATLSPAAAAPQPRLKEAATSHVAHRRTARVAEHCGGPRHCHAVLMAADARLRRAYAAAERADVPRSVLVDYHRRWSSLRRRAHHQPALVAARYRAMASDLDRMTTRPRVAHAEPPSVGPFRRFRMQLAALWR